MAHTPRNERSHSDTPLSHITQIAVVPASNFGAEAIFALLSDGTLWMHTANVWKAVDPPPPCKSEH